MGTWGTGILQDDLAADAYGAYADARDSGISPADAYRDLLARFDGVDPPSPWNIPFWLGLAQAQWEFGELTQDVVRRVQAALASGDDAARWNNEAKQRRRLSVTSRFLRKLSAPPAKTRRPAARRSHPPIFQPGDCLSVSLLDGGYGAAIVLAVEPINRDTDHLVGGLRGVFEQPPSLDVFETRDWLRLTHGSHGNQLHLIWCCSSSHPQDCKTFPVSRVCRTELRPDDPAMPRLAIGSGFSSWGWIENQIRMQHAWERRLLQGVTRTNT